MISDFTTAAFIVSLLSGMVRVATPILFAALGELVTERSGVLNLGVEGTMLMGAFVGFLAAFRTGSLWLGVLAALIAGGMMGLIMAFMASTLKVDQIVTGLALNLFAAGVSFYWYRVAFQGSEIRNIPTVISFRALKIPLLSEIPVLGEILFSQSALTYLALAMTVAVWFFLYRTKHGLQIRGVGENPRAIDMKGVSVSRLRYLAVIFGGLMAGVGGAYLSLVSVGLFVPGMTAGRGWLALVVVIAGNWKPFRILLAAMIFGLLDSFQLLVQGTGGDLPHQIFLALPYVAAIVLLIGGRIRSRAPLALGTPYRRD